jgi:hypothetical protein
MRMAKTGDASSPVFARSIRTLLMHYGMAVMGHEAGAIHGIPTSAVALNGALSRVMGQASVLLR